MQNAQVSNPNDFKVVSFHNSELFGFTSEMGCMYDGRPINGKSGMGIEAGETLILPYHVGHLLSRNLAKRVLNTSEAATVDQKGVPTGVPIWSQQRLDELANSFIKELYAEEKPAGMSETDKLMAKVEEYRKLVEEKLGSLTPKVEVKSTEGAQTVVMPPLNNVLNFQDKQEVITELEKRGIKHDKRSKKVDLEKLLA
jgi:hypothetical protein